MFYVRVGRAHKSSMWRDNYHSRKAIGRTYIYSYADYLKKRQGFSRIIFISLQKSQVNQDRTRFI
jgi:hypothetical protein